MASSQFPRFRYDPGTGDIDIDLTSTLRGHNEFNTKTNAVDRRGGKGRRQRNFNYNDKTLTARLWFITKAQRDLLEIMYDTHASRGKTIIFFPDQADLPTFFTVKIINRDIDFGNLQFPAREFYAFDFELEQDIT